MTSIDSAPSDGVSYQETVPENPELLELFLNAQNQNNHDPSSDSESEEGDSNESSSDHCADNGAAGTPVGKSSTSVLDTTSATSVSTSGTSTNAATIPDSMTVNGGQIDTGSYLISGSAKDDGSLTITDKASGKSVEVWGDPHISENGQEAANIQQKTLLIHLPDGTQVQINPTATTNGVAHIASATVTKDGETATLTGQNGTFQNGVTSATSVAAPDTTSHSVSDSRFQLTLDTDDQLYMPCGSKLQSTNGPVDLDKQSQNWTLAEALREQPNTMTGSGVSVKNGQIDTGEYLISAGSNDDGSLTVTDKATNKSFEVWGDPHVKVDGSTIAEFQTGALNINLPDGTNVQVNPTQLSNGVAHIASATVTRDNESVTISGNNGTFQNGVTMSNVANGATAPNASGSGNIDLRYGADDNLHYSNGATVTAQANGSQTNLNAAPNGTQSASSPDRTDTGGTSPQDMQQEIKQLELKILREMEAQLESGFNGQAGAGQSSSGMSGSLQQLVSMMSLQSGFDQSE